MTEIYRDLNFRVNGSMVKVIPKTSLSAVNDGAGRNIVSTYALKSELTDGTVSRIGTATLGSTDTPVYLKNGVPTVCSQLALKTALSDGSVTKIGTADVGSTSKPIYLAKGVPTVATDVLDTTSNQIADGVKSITVADFRGGMKLNNSNNVYSHIVTLGAVGEVMTFPISISHRYGSFVGMGRVSADATVFELRGETADYSTNNVFGQVMRFGIAVVDGNVVVLVRRASNAGQGFGCYIPWYSYSTSVPAPVRILSGTDITLTAEQEATFVIATVTVGNNTAQYVSDALDSYGTMVRTTSDNTLSGNNTFTGIVRTTYTPPICGTYFLTGSGSSAKTGWLRVAYIERTGQTHYDDESGCFHVKFMRGATNSYNSKNTTANAQGILTVACRSNVQVLQWMMAGASIDLNCFALVDRSEPYEAVYNDDGSVDTTKSKYRLELWIKTYTYTLISGDIDVYNNWMIQMIDSNTLNNPYVRWQFDTAGRRTDELADELPAGAQVYSTMMPMRSA